jgi:hypothetical protein
MSLATFKKKSINSSSSATKRSGKLTNEYWLYQGPYGNSDTVASTIYKLSLNSPNGDFYYTGKNAGFSIIGSNRNVGRVGSSMMFSKSGTPYRGIYPKGWGGNWGKYPDSKNDVLMNITPVETGVAIQNAIVKPPVLSTKGMLERSFKWIKSGKYPNYWVQPIYTGYQTDSASQGLYIQNKSAANDIYYDVNNVEKYIDCYKNCGSTGCQITPERGYTMSIQQANAPYTKNIYQPRDSSDYTLHIQRRCQAPVGLQKPFPYAVQTGTGILRGGLAVNNVGNACNTSNTVLTPPDWYTGVTEIPTLKEQLENVKKIENQLKIT